MPPERQDHAPAELRYFSVSILPVYFRILRLSSRKMQDFLLELYQPYLDSSRLQLDYHLVSKIAKESLRVNEGDQDAHKRRFAASHCDKVSNWDTEEAIQFERT